MSISEKINATINKIEQNKAQYDLDGKTAKILAFSSGNVSKYKFFGKDNLPEKHLLEKAATMKRFEYSSLGKDLKAQTDIAKKLYQTFDNDFESNIMEENIRKTKRRHAKSNYILP